MTQVDSDILFFCACALVGVLLSKVGDHIDAAGKPAPAVLRTGA